MSRTATTEEVAAALHVRPATVRKYARSHRLPFDTTPGGHRRFDVDEAVRAIRGDRSTDGDVGGEHSLHPSVPYVRVEPSRVVAATAVVTAVEDTAGVIVRDRADVIDDWATQTPVV